MDAVAHIVHHALEDTLPIVPFLLVTYIVLELLEHMAGERVNAAVRRAGAAGPVVGAVLGIVPQCGFSAMASTLFAGRVITVGTLVAVFLSTSDEMLPLLLAERVDAGLVAQILIIKALIAAVVGLAGDAVLKVLRKSERAHAAVRRHVLGASAAAAHEGAEHDLIDDFAEGGEGADHIHRLCERDRCGCDDAHEAHAHGDGHGHGHEHGHDHAHAGARGLVWSVARSALSHTVQVTIFIFLVTLVLVAVLETAAEPALEALLSGNAVLAVFAAALVGLIPNCAASVVVTQLYLEGVLGFGAMLAGTLVGAGAGFLVLFRTNRSVRENVVILAALYVVAVACGIIATFAS